MRVHAGLKRFKEFDITEGKSEDQVQSAGDWLEEAYRAVAHEPLDDTRTLHCAPPAV